MVIIVHITFLGAARMVTGSCYYLECEQAKFLVDCGLFQGSSEERDLNNRSFPFHPGDLDFVLLTHAHIDHSGYLPKLCQLGFQGRIITTQATADLCQVMLPDSGHIQEMEAERHNRKRVRQGAPPIEPLYTVHDAQAALKYFYPVHYGEAIEAGPGVTVRFRDAGHILGSAILENWIQEGDKRVKLVFTGDIGQYNQPIVRDPALIEAADYIILESTYGNRYHINHADRTERLAEAVNRAVQAGGKLIIPSFAVGRTQDILYHLKQLRLAGQIPRNIPVYIDSPMAVSATETFRRNSQYFDEETYQLLRKGENPFEFPGLNFVRTTEESKRLNQTDGQQIIISASGMCEAGRILHHLRHNLWRPETHVLFVGYQAEGTLGRRLLDGAKAVKIFGEEIIVKAQILQIEGFSAHADQTGMLEWLGGFVQKPRTVFLVHGDADVFPEFEEKIREVLNYPTIVPELGQSFELAEKATEEVRVAAVPDATDYFRHLLLTLDEKYLDFRGRLRQQAGELGANELAVFTKELERLNRLLEEKS